LTNSVLRTLCNYNKFSPFDKACVLIVIPLLPEGGGGYTVLPLSILPSVQDSFRRIFLSNCWWQKSDIWSQASHRYTILWVAFLDPSDSYFLFADFVGFYTHWTYMHIFRHIFLSNYWWQRSDKKKDKSKTVYPPPPSGSRGITIRTHALSNGENLL
jgi:hypothetical protein